MRYGVAIGVLCCVVTCTPEPPAELPPIAKPAFTTVEWSWCDVRVPPLMDCGEWGSASDVGVGTFINAEIVCRLAEELKRCLIPEDWARIEGIKVCRVSGVTYIVADLPKGRGRFWVFFYEETGEFSCG